MQKTATTRPHRQFPLGISPTWLRHQNPRRFYSVASSHWVSLQQMNRKPYILEVPLSPLPIGYLSNEVAPVIKRKNIILSRQFPLGISSTQVAAQFWADSLVANSHWVSRLHIRTHVGSLFRKVANSHWVSRLLFCRIQGIFLHQCRQFPLGISSTLENNKRTKFRGRSPIPIGYLVYLESSEQTNSSFTTSRQFPLGISSTLPDLLKEVESRLRRQFPLGISSTKHIDTFLVKGGVANSHWVSRLHTINLGLAFAEVANSHWVSRLHRILPSHKSDSNFCRQFPLGISSTSKSSHSCSSYSLVANSHWVSRLQIKD